MSDDAQRKRNIFQYQGKPVTFFLDPSIKNSFQRENLIRGIVVRALLDILCTVLTRAQDHGGKVLDVELGADTVLINERRSTRDLRSHQLGHSLDRDAKIRRSVVEPMRFVQECIGRKEFYHGIVPQQPMGGCIGRCVPYFKKDSGHDPVDRLRTNFTEEDDDNLCWYLSQTTPDPVSGGRLSKKIYSELMAAVSEVFLCCGSYSPKK